jgi:hypothetical protein
MDRSLKLIDVNFEGQSNDSPNAMLDKAQALEQI